MGFYVEHLLFCAWFLFSIVLLYIFSTKMLLWKIFQIFKKYIFKYMHTTKTGNMLPILREASITWHGDVYVNVIKVQWGYYPGCYRQIYCSVTWVVVKPKIMLIIVIKCLWLTFAKKSCPCIDNWIKRCLMLINFILEKMEERKFLWWFDKNSRN